MIGGFGVISACGEGCGEGLRVVDDGYTYGVSATVWLHKWKYD